MLNRACWLGKARRRCGTAPASIFAHPGPSGPAGIEALTQILRAGNILPALRDNPRNGVRGRVPLAWGNVKCPTGFFFRLCVDFLIRSRPHLLGKKSLAVGHSQFSPGLGGARERSIGCVPGGVFAFEPPWKKNSPPAGGEIPRVQRTQSEPCPLIRHGFAVPPFPIPSVASRHLPLTRGVGPRGEGFWGRGSFVRSFSKRSRKAGQRRGGEIPRALYLLWLKPPQSGFNKEGSTHETNQMRKRRNLQT